LCRRPPFGPDFHQQPPPLSSGKHVAAISFPVRNAPDPPFPSFCFAGTLRRDPGTQGPLTEAAAQSSPHDRSTSSTARRQPPTHLPLPVFSLLLSSPSPPLSSHPLPVVSSAPQRRFRSPPAKRLRGWHVSGGAGDRRGEDRRRAPGCRILHGCPKSRTPSGCKAGAPWDHGPRSTAGPRQPPRLIASCHESHS
jgi:hypothetical protein